jgi:hypothetical protein
VRAAFEHLPPPPLQACEARATAAEGEILLF